MTWKTFLFKVVKYVSAMATGYEVKNFFEEDDNDGTVVKYIADIKSAISEGNMEKSIENGLDGASEWICIYLVIAIFFMLLLSAGAKLYSCIKKSAVKEYKDDLEMVRIIALC